MTPFGQFGVAVVFLAGCSASRAAMQERLPAGEVWLTSDEVTRAGVALDPVGDHGIDDVLVTSGRVSFDEQRVAHIASPVSGRVVDIEGVLGGHVKKGQVLAVIHSPDLGDATSALSKAMADLVATEHAYRRAKELRAGGGASDAAVEQAEDAWRQAKAEVERAQEKVALFHAGHAVTQSYPLVSPIEGDILARNINPGVELQGTYVGGTPTYAGGNLADLFTVGNLDQVWVFADVYETDLARVQAGQKVQVSVVGIPTTFEGKIDYLSSMLDPQTRTARLRCTIPNPENLLKPEMYGTIRVSVAPTQALSVPRSAILHLGGQQLVFVDRGLAPDGRQRYERLPIIADETGNNPFVAVEHGLERGDRIVIKGADVLSTKV
jgi:cobalt-zinc-cadmium efflux system membrane fusion protein